VTEFVRHGDHRDVLAGEIADLILTSPPYNLASKASVERRDGFRKEGRYDPKSFAGVKDYPDDLPEDEYQDSQVEFLLWAEQHLAVSGLLVYNHKPRRRQHRIISPYEWLLRSEVRDKLVVAQEIVWDRGSTMNHDATQMWPQTERLWVLRRPGDTWTFRHDKDSPLPHRSDVWRVPLDTRKAGRVAHSAAFPDALVDAALLAYSREGQLVMDPYAGSGSTGVGCMRLGRRFVGAELVEKFVEPANQRIETELVLCSLRSLASRRLYREMLAELATVDRTALLPESVERLAIAERYARERLSVS
jgi:DNA modification methylase